MEEVLRIIGRQESLFAEDLRDHEAEIQAAVRKSSFLVVGGAGSIGSAVVKELFAADPRVLHVVDVSENNLAELVRDIRSSLGYIEGDFKTYCLDCGSAEFEAFMRDGRSYDHMLNFSALKHVRSEKDPYTLMRLIEVNIQNTERALAHAARMGCPRYFCVSTDKATNPVNMMGASKRIMEMFLMRASEKLHVSSARFANVAFSDGSLLYAFKRRMEKGQPLSAPNDVKRYFVTEKEAGLLCVLATFLSENRDVFFPKLSSKLHLVTFSQIAERYLLEQGFTPHVCDSEEEARRKVGELRPKKRWPCYFFESDTTGEKDFEEFYTDSEQVDWDRFRDIGVIRNDVPWEEAKLERFLARIEALRSQGRWTKIDLVDLFNDMLSNFSHLEREKYLDDRM
jgi:FlaA1/EpsC-like NDP-sugar epimerase